jgi:hypothetical protein
MAYTKYSLTPADNNAAPPNGAPEGMLPSAVNDTMRDMMAQIRDVGDGIRGGTYTMTAPVITGGTITGVALTGNTFTSPVISGGSINNTPIGGTTAAAGKFTTLEATGVTTVQAGTVSAPAITTTGDTNTGIFFPAADTIAFTEGGAESMRIDSSGNVGIGKTNPATKLEVKGTHQSGSGLINIIADSGTRYSTLSFTNNTSQKAILFHDNTDNVLDIYGAAGQGIRFTTNDAERLRIPSDAAGIQFPATQAASSNANTLDDYEEGTFTPTVQGVTSAGTASYSVQVGSYTKIGNLVSVNIYLTYSSGTGTGQLRIAGLPFTSAGSLLPVASVYLDNIAVTAAHYPQVIMNASSTTIDFYQSAGAGSGSLPYDAAGTILLSLTYRV